MKHASTCIALAGLLFAGLGHATDVAQPAMAGVANAPHHALQDQVADAQKRLDALGKKLNLQSSQQDAWKAFSAAMTKHAQERAQEMAQRGPVERSKLEELATPDKMEKMAAAMRQGADRLSKLASDTKSFYEQLSSEQKTIFDLYAKNAWRDRMHNRMRGHMR